MLDFHKVRPHVKQQTWFVWKEPSMAAIVVLIAIWMAVSAIVCVSVCIVSSRFNRASQAKEFNTEDQRELSPWQAAEPPPGLVSN